MCTKILRSSLKKAIAQLGLNYSSVGTVIRLWTEQRNRSSLQEENGFLHSQTFSPFLGPTQLPSIQWVWRNIFPDVNPPGHKADLSLLTSEWLSMSGGMPPFSNMPSCLTQEQLNLVAKLCLKSSDFKIQRKKFNVTCIKFLNASNDKTPVSRTAKDS